ncbi:GMC family oxidoreductase [Skermanella stibiiresistens SB22]|uniref:GMC family oxidoreductase n=1 Tax=Skermanella stibiiresistens SB22 TaxID=1385369 RepID=W9HCK5_9PROT|nr:GMC family oxidoreductase [Skermanella stibiiresistens]EWY42442.1 GMC family oxidoreductase [Skermanella stibiiresistens SB22]
MAKKLNEVDVVLVGMGWTGSIMARELSKAGLNVVALERGPNRIPGEDFTLPNIRDELRFSVRQELMQDPAQETVTFRHATDKSALPMRRFGSFLPGDGVGGMGTHWNAQTYRFLPSDHTLRTDLTKRYGKKKIPDDMLIADWGVTYDELEVHYDRFEKLCGLSGKAGNLRGEIQKGGNPFEGWRSAEYPNKPLKPSMAGVMFEKAATELGYSPFPAPAGNMSASYVNPEGVRLGACQYCGHCERFGCEANAKSSPNTTLLPVLVKEPKVEIRDRCYASRLVYDKAGKKVTAVVYVDLRTGEEYEQPAGMVFLSAWVFGNTQMLLHSGIGQPYDPKTGKGVVGRNYCHQIQSAVGVFFEDKELNPFMAAGSLGMVIDDFNGENFDHKDVDFLGGGYIALNSTNGRPILNRPVPPGTPRWGSEWKEATAKWYRRAASMNCQGSNYASRGNYLDLDPTYKDILGRPLVRMTYNFTDNDRKMSAFLTEKGAGIAKAMGATHISANPRKGDFDVVPYQSSHNTGGTPMGTDPKTSVVNRYLQHWDAHNLFVLGASVFPQNAGYNPTGAVGALTYWVADAVVNKYLKNPNHLIKA